MLGSREFASLLAEAACFPLGALKKLGVVGACDSSLKMLDSADSAGVWTDAACFPFGTLKKLGVVGACDNSLKMLDSSGQFAGLLPDADCSPVWTMLFAGELWAGPDVAACAPTDACCLAAGTLI